MLQDRVGPHLRSARLKLGWRDEKCQIRISGFIFKIKSSVYDGGIVLGPFPVLVGVFGVLIVGTEPCFHLSVK